MRNIKRGKYRNRNSTINKIKPIESNPTKKKKIKTNKKNIKIENNFSRNSKITIKNIINSN